MSQPPVARPACSIAAPSTGRRVRAFWQYAPVTSAGHAQRQVVAPASALAAASPSAASEVRPPLSTHSPTPEHAKGHLGASSLSSRTGKNVARSRTSRASSALEPGGFHTATTYKSPGRAVFSVASSSSVSPPASLGASGGSGGIPITTLV
jgi:hypothetical protein